jgi:hypothetical protein
MARARIAHRCVHQLTVHGLSFCNYFCRVISRIANPALDALIACVAPELVFAQVLLRKTSEGFELRHAADRDAASLRGIPVQKLRDLAQFTASGQFRPLKSAPTLQRGWRCVAPSAVDLDEALRHLYPGAVADWFAAQQPSPPITHYREFTARQTGMYRITTMLNDEQVAQVARAGCHRRFCLKQRLWTVEGLAPDNESEKSLIRCLEPCAVLLEFARAVVRFAQQGGAADVIESTAPGVEIREANFSTVENPRFGQWRMEKAK